MKKTILTAALCLAASSAFAQVTKIGRFGNAVDFTVTKVSRETEGAAHQVEVHGYTVNVEGTRAPFNTFHICYKTGHIYVREFLGKTFEMEPAKRRQQIANAPMSAGFFAIHDKYCGGKWSRSAMSRSETKAFGEND